MEVPFGQGLFIQRARVVRAWRGRAGLRVRVSLGCCHEAGVALVGVARWGGGGVGLFTS